MYSSLTKYLWWGKKSSSNDKNFQAWEEISSFHLFGSIRQHFSILGIFYNVKSISVLSTLESLFHKPTKSAFVPPTRW